MINTPYVVVFGSINYDIIFKQQRLPLIGETYTSDSVFFGSGGKGANQAVQCAKLGAKTFMVGKVGNDVFGNQLLETISCCEVDVSNIKRSDINTGIGVDNILYDGSLYATISTGANFDFTTDDVEEYEELIKKAGIIILQMEIPTKVNERIIHEAAEHGVYIILNGAPAKEISREALKLVNCFIVNEPEASFYVGYEIKDFDSALQHYKKLLAMVKDTLIITLGSNGSVICSGSDFDFVRPFPVETIGDTVGAGDSYIGAYAVKKLSGENDLAACNFASKAAAFTVSSFGAQPAMPFLRDIE